MRRFRKVVFVFVVVQLLLAAFWSTVLAQTDPEVVITFFWRDGCSHCAEEKPFLLELADKYPQIVLNGYEVYHNAQNRDYLISLGEAMDFETNGVPVTVIGDQVWIGYTEAIGAEIEAAVAACQDSGCVDPAAANNIDISQTNVSLEVVEAGTADGAQASFPIWIAAAVLLVVLAYFVGRAKAKSKPKSKKKPARKRH